MISTRTGRNVSIGYTGSSGFVSYTGSTSSSSSSSGFAGSSVSTFRRPNYSNNAIIDYSTMQNDIGSEITSILVSFANGDESLTTLIEYDAYMTLADKLASYIKTGTDNISTTFELYRKGIVDSIEAAKRANTRQLEQATDYEVLQVKYDALLEYDAPDNFPTSAFEATATSEVVALPKPEIIEYVNRGYALVDSNGHLIPLDMDVIALIRYELGL